MRGRTCSVGVGLIVGLCLSVGAQARMTSALSQRIGAGTLGSKIALYAGISLGIENGDMTYTIRGPEDGGWRSELEWPLDGILYIGSTASALIGERFQIGASLWKSVRDDAGTMKDSDWIDELIPYLELFYGDDKAVYGEFDSTVDAVEFDLNGQFALLRQSNFVLNALAGYAYTKWEWTAGNGFQYSPFPELTGWVDGTGIIYTQTLNVPYLGVSVLFTPMPEIGMNLYTHYSPFAQCEDVDDHVKRYKKSTGQADGTFFSAGGEVSWYFGGGFSLSGNVNYSVYDLQGEQDQYFYAGEDAGLRYDGIDLTVIGKQVSMGVLFGYTL